MEPAMTVDYVTADKLRPGDVISVTWDREGGDSTVERVAKLKDGLYCVRTDTFYILLYPHEKVIRR